MVNGIYLSTAGMIPRITQIDNVSNNLANLSTYGFKKNNMFIRELVTAQQALDHANGIERSETPEEVWTDFSQGTFDKTERTFDFALNGPGFFKVRDENGQILYTRDGRFHLDSNNVLVSSSGMQVLDEFSNLIVVDGDEVVVQGNGEVLVDGELTGTVGLVDFDEASYQQLKGVGLGLFEKPQAVNEIMASDDTRVLQGVLEDANVDPVKTMVEMIEIFRTYELGQKAIQIQDQSLQRVVSEVGSVR